MGADVLATHGARASATMIFTMLNRIDSVPVRWGFNPLRAKFFRENINIYLHFVSYLHIDTTQVVEILPQIRQEPTYFT